MAWAYLDAVITNGKDEAAELDHETVDQPSRRNAKDAGSRGGAGAGAGDGLELQLEGNQNHVDDDTHWLSFDDNSEPVLHIERAGHHPQGYAFEQLVQEEYVLQVSVTGGGAGGGTAPTAKAVQLNADRIGSSVHGERARPQLFWMVFIRVLAVTYA